MAFVIAMLIFPEVQDKAQAEIDQIVGHDRLPEMSDLDQLPYLKNLVQELLRWQPVLPLGTSDNSNEKWMANDGGHRCGPYMLAG